MSDSDTDVFSNNVFTHQNRSTRVCAKGPNVNTTSFNVQNNNMLTASMNMHWNMERPRYAESVYDQRSLYSRRETSPMSFHSASGLHLRNLHHSYYPGGMSSQRSMYNGRSGSPMSVRTIDSNTSATDIALALKTRKFNRFDMQIIKEAYNKFIKRRVRRRIEKRRNLRTFLKGCRRVSGGESGDQASDSSLSSDDHRSVRSSKTATFNHNANRSSSKINLMNLKKTMKESGMYRDCTEHLRQNRFLNMLSVPPGNMQEHLQSRLNNTSLMSKHGRHGFLLPSQRFNANQFVAPPPIPEMPCLGPQIFDNQITNGTQNTNLNNFNKNRDHIREPSQETISEQEEIFSEITMMQKNSDTKSQRKRVLEEENITFGRKKNKLSTPVKNVVNHDTRKPKQTVSKSNNQGSRSDFVFAIPQQPVKKPASVKNLNVKSLQVTSGKSKSFKMCSTIPSKTQTPQIVLNPQQQETLISKSQAPVKEIIPQIQTPRETVYQSPEKIISKSSQPLDLEQQRNLNPPQNSYEKDQHEMTHLTTDISMRPSFIKRKLFTQKVDETENNGSSESFQTQSPQSNIYSKIHKEKNKARKLVTQSCLSRDLGDTSNLLDLIYKIVPPDRMNLTTVTNKSEIQMNKDKSANSDKWDITAIITTNKSEELSDTFTDDEIFKNDETKQNHANNKQNYIENNKKENVVAKNKNNSTLKTVDKQCKPVNSKIVIDNNIKYSNKVLLTNSEKAETYKTTDTNNRTKYCPKLPKSPKIILQKISPQIVRQMENVKNLQSNNELSTFKNTNDVNNKTKYCVKSFWNETDSDCAATSVKKPELNGKGLTKSRTVNHSFYNQRTNTQIEVPIRQASVTAKTSLTTNTTLHKAHSKSNKILDDAPTKGKVIQSKKKTDEKLQVNKIVKVQVQQNKERAFNNGLKSKQNNTETNKKTYIKSTPSATKVNITRKEDKIIKINNNPVQIRTKKIPKFNKNCTDCILNDTVNTADETKLCRTLRSRVIDLSTSLDTESSPLNKKTVLKKNKQKPVKNKNVKKLSDKENISKTSDQSFTLSSETPLASKLAANKRVKNVNNVKPNVTKSRQSDVSFVLGEKVLNQTAASTRRHKEVEKLRLGTPKFFNSGKKSPLSKRVESTRLNKSRSSVRLNRSKLY